MSTGETTNTGTSGAGKRPARRVRALAGMICAVAALSLLGASCATGAPAGGNPLVGELTTRDVSVSTTGSVTYSETNRPAVASGPDSGFELTYDSSSAVVKVNGTLKFQSASGTAELTLNLNAGLNGLEGSAKIVDPAAGVSRTVSGTAAGFTADDLGNVGGSISANGNSITFQTTSHALPPATDAALETLMQANDDFCAEAQQVLAGLDPTEVPVSAINNIHQSPRSAFTASKSDGTPLTTQSWFDSIDVESAGGLHVTVSRNISCKTREAQHLESLGYNSAVGASCADLNAASIALAMEQLSPADQAAATPPALGPDVIRTTGSEWTTPLSKAAEFDGTTLRGHALLTRWNDPDFQIFPDNIRGVHYCTIWSPAYAYTYLLSTLP